MPALMLGIPVIWNICWYSGSVRAAWKTCSASLRMRIDVAFAGPMTCAMTRP